MVRYLIRLTSEFLKDILGYIFYPGDTPFTITTRFAQSECSKKIQMTIPGRRPEYEEIKKFLISFTSFLPPIYRFGEESYFLTVWKLFFVFFVKLTLSQLTELFASELKAIPVFVRFACEIECFKINSSLVEEIFHQN
jgi:hypothetical protein